MSVPEKKPEPALVVKTGIYLIFGYALYALVSSIYNSVTLRDRMNALLEQQNEPVTLRMGTTVASTFQTR